jgi:hypothetical protein
MLWFHDAECAWCGDYKIYFEPRNEHRDAFAWKVEKKGDDEKNAEWKQTREMITKYLGVYLSPNT